ncbi:MAG: hypothetical protein LC778_10230 [Acidobacteria bacterium]|nr:hypothetical protein [Acidobacteriota bacterium]
MNSYLRTFIDSGIRWTVPAATAGTLLSNFDIREQIVLRDLRPLVLTLEVTGSGVVQALIRPFNRTGVAQTDILGNAVTLNTTWQSVSLTYSPGSNDATCAVGLNCQSGAGERIITTTAIKCRDSNDDPRWSIGGGIGEVAIIDFDAQYNTFHTYEISFTVREV